MRAIAALGLTIAIGVFVHSIAGATQRSMIEQIHQQQQTKN